MDRNTIQKSLVDDAVHMLDHPTAEEVYEYISVKHPTVSRATVYRNLAKLTEQGAVLHIPLADAPDRYDKTAERHYHAKCEYCGRVCDVGVKDIDLLKWVTDTGGCDIKDYDIVFRGICPECKNNKNQ